MNCQTFSTGFNSGDRGGRNINVMFSGTLELRRDVPASLIEDEHCMRAGTTGLADFGEMLLHGPGIAIGKNKTCALAFLRADRAEDIGPHGPLIGRCRWSCSSPCPSPGDLVLLSYSGFVGPPDFDIRAGRAFFPDRQSGGEVFLKTSPSSSFCA